MNEHEIRTLQKAVERFTPDEFMATVATLANQGYEQKDLAWIFRDYSKESLLANNRYPGTYRPIGELPQRKVV